MALGHEIFRKITHHIVLRRAQQPCQIAGGEFLDSIGIFGIDPLGERPLESRDAPDIGSCGPDLLHPFAECRVAYLHEPLLLAVKIVIPR